MKIRITVEFDTVEAPYDPKKAFEDFEEAQATYLDVIQEALSQECHNGPVKITVEEVQDKCPLCGQTGGQHYPACTQTYSEVDDA